MISYFNQDKEKLVTTMSGLKEEVLVLSYKLEDTIKYGEMLNKDSDMIDEIVEDGKRLRLKTGVKLLEEI